MSEQAETYTSGSIARDIDVVARAEIVANLEYALSVGDISHASCPDVGVNDWTWIVTRIQEIMSSLSPSDEDRMTAYTRLIERAEEVD